MDKNDDGRKVAAGLVNLNKVYKAKIRVLERTGRAQTYALYGLREENKAYRDWLTEALKGDSINKDELIALLAAYEEAGADKK